MKRFTYLGNRGHLLDHAVGHIVKLWADEAHPFHAFYLRDGLKKIRKAMLSVPVGIDSLAKQRNLASPLANPVGRLAENLIHGMVNLAPANVRDNTIRARVVASPHDGDERRDLVAGRGMGVIEFFVRLAPLEQPLRDKAEILDRFSANHEIHERKSIFKVLFGALCRAAGNDDFPAGVSGFPALQPPDFRKSTILRMLPDGAGIDEQNRRLIRILSFH